MRKRRRTFRCSFPIPFRFGLAWVSLGSSLREPESVCSGIHDLWAPRLTAAGWKGGCQKQIACEIKGQRVVDFIQGRGPGVSKLFFKLLEDRLWREERLLFSRYSLQECWVEPSPRSPHVGCGCPLSAPYWSLVTLLSITMRAPSTDCSLGPWQPWKGHSSGVGYLSVQIQVLPLRTGEVEQGI